MQTQSKKLLGVIGGLGPMATAVFLERIVCMTDAHADQEHIDIAVRHCPSIPDRTAFILGRSGDDPLPGIIQQALSLRDQGACCIAIPCITAHFFHDAIEQACALPVIDTVSLTAKELLASGVRRAAVWATEGTVHTGLFQKALARVGIEAVLPDEMTQTVVTDCIYRDIKAGRSPDPSPLLSAQQRLLSEGVQALILGCTELSVAARSVPFAPGVIDALDVLAKASVIACDAPVKPEYACLLSK